MKIDSKIQHIVDLIEEAEGIYEEDREDVCDQAMDALGLSEDQKEEVADLVYDGLQEAVELIVRYSPSADAVLQAFEGEYDAASEATHEQPEDPNQALAVAVADWYGDGRPAMFTPFTPLHEDALPNDTPLIHFSAAADKIMSEGFQYGVPSIDRDALGFTLHREKQQQPGYGFAFLADPERREWEISHGLMEGMSADKAILFRSAGVHVRHYDDFEQVIFWGPSADLTDAVLLTAVDPGEVDENGLARRWKAFDHTGHQIAAGTLFDVILDCTREVDVAPECSI